MRDKIIAEYIRLSSEDCDLDSVSKAESDSIVNQRMVLGAYIKARNEFDQYQILEFCDEGYSGTNFERPAFQKMMLLVKSGGIDCIIVKDLSRLGRSYLDVSAYLELIFPMFGIRLISVNDNFDSKDYEGTTGGMELAFRNMVYGMYSRDISVKVLSALKTRRKSGAYIGGHPFYGYRKDPKDKHHLIVDEEVRPVVKMIFQLSADGWSTMMIAKRLNEEGILCPVEYKKTRGISYSKKLSEEKALWIQSTVRKIIKDERYTGKMVSNVRSSAVIGKNIMKNNARQDWIIVEGTHEPIISQELFDAANIALSSRVKTVNKNTTWKTSGNLFVCGYCGRKLQKSKGKTTHLYCIKSRYKNESSCTRIHENLENIQGTVLQVIKEMERALTDNSVIVKKKKIEDDSKQQNELHQMQQRIQRHKAEKLTLYEEYRDGKISKEQFMEIQKKQATKLEYLENQMNQKVEEMERGREEKKKMQLVCDELKSVSILKEYDADIIGRVVEKVIVYDGGRIELVMKSRDAYEAVFALDCRRGA
ncbi:MAG: recombinase family protein [Hungatella sp.]